MNNKMMTFVTLAVFLACSASAQMTTILPGGRGNLYIGTPMTLPGPVSNIVISPRINLPAPLTPLFALTLAPVPAAASIPVLPVSLLGALREIRFAAPPRTAPSKDIVAAREKLENIFDGRRQPSEKNASEDLSPVRSGRRHNLPENDLEKEIGAY